MADPRSRLQIVEEVPDVDQPRVADKPDPFLAAGTSALLLGLKTLSQRAIAEARTYFTLFSVGSAWWLWYAIPDPKPTQIVALALYGILILAANVIVRRF